MAFPSGLVQFWECLRWDCGLRTEVNNLPLCPGASYDQAEAHPQRCSVLCPEYPGCVPRLLCAEGIVTGSLENWWQSTFLSPNNSCYLWQLLSSKQSNLFPWVVSDKLSRAISGQLFRPLWVSVSTCFCYPRRSIQYWNFRLFKIEKLFLIIVKVPFQSWELLEFNVEMVK